MSKAERQAAEEKLRRYPRVSKSAGKLAAAVRVLLEMTDTSPGLSLELVWNLIENTVTRAEQRAALSTVDDLVLAADAQLDGQKLEELAGRVATVRTFLPSLMRAVEFGAISDARPLLAAMYTLADLLTESRPRGVPARWLDARRVNHDLVSGGWQRLVYPPDRPAETVDRAAYTLCLLEQFHRNLKHRNIFAEHSSKWRDPRAHLLSGVVWEQAREAGMNALGLPDNPHPLLAGHAAALDAAYRELAAGLGDDVPASVDADGKLHVAALTATPDPPSLIDLRVRVEAMLPRLDLPELVLEVMSWHLGFIEAFTHVSGNPARVGDLGLSVAAVLCAHAMNVGFKPVASPGVEALTRDRLHHVDQHDLRFDTLAAANAVLVDAQADIGLARLWGGGLVASVDGIRFVVPVRTHHARPNPKYFGRSGCAPRCARTTSSAPGSTHPAPQRA
ncbi:Tn3 family transposase [Nocardia arizonensis]|uniref:Tn3 family transposase n=1 Tax=Nocardia arizonensis TaxID=1141647 RepID=UPI0006D133F5|nr:Tn3 family transposase [Nocardia arizonensis]